MTFTADANIRLQLHAHYAATRKRLFGDFPGERPIEAPSIEALIIEALQEAGPPEEKIERLANALVSRWLNCGKGTPALQFIAGLTAAYYELPVKELIETSRLKNLPARRTAVFLMRVVFHQPKARIISFLPIKMSCLDDDLKFVRRDLSPFEPAVTCISNALFKAGKRIAVPVAARAARLDKARGCLLPSMLSIIAVTAAYYGLSEVDLTGSSRDEQLAKRRYIVSHLGSEVFPHAASLIGRALHRDHTTIVHERRRALELIATEEEFAFAVVTIKQLIEAAWIEALPIRSPEAELTGREMIGAAQ